MAERKLQAVRDFLKAYSFHMEKDAVEIMAGSDEGVRNAWMQIALARQGDSSL